MAFERKVTVNTSGRYLLSLPGDYTQQNRKRFPLILFLHGSGESGSDLDKVKLHGPPKLIEQGRKLPFVIVSPQCPAPVGWDPITLLGLLDEIQSKYRIDRDRVYLTGLSMGGYGTWKLASMAPERFAAIAPVCGGGDPAWAPILKDLPIWSTHGDKDPAVPIGREIPLIDALKNMGSTVRFDIIQDAGHDVWTDFYEKSEFYDWLLKHNLKDRRTKK
jgi:predicted peptidase